MRTFPLLVLLFAGCAPLSGKPEGDWLLVVDHQSSICDGESETDLDEPVQARATTWKLKDGTFVFSVEGLMLTGEATREGFTLSNVSGATMSDPDCTSYEESLSVTFNGSFGDDLAMGGVIEVKRASSAVDCFGQNYESSCTDRYKIQGILLQSTRQDHLNAGGGSIGDDTGYF